MTSNASGPSTSISLRLALIVGLLVGATCPEAGAAHSSRRLTVTTPPLTLPPLSDVQGWIAVRFPAKGDSDIAGIEMENVGATSDVASHHLRVYAATERSDLATIALRQKKWGQSSGGIETMDLVGGSQVVRLRQVADDGLALHLAAFAPPGKRRRSLWLMVNSHWINGSSRTRRGRVRLTLIPAVPPVKRYLKPIFEGTANAGLFVPPGTARSTEDSTRALDQELSDRGIPFVLEDAWGPGLIGAGAIAPSSGALSPPAGPACVSMLTAHMHLRGTLFAVDFVDSDGQVKNGEPLPSLENPYEPGRFHLFVSHVYDDPAEIHFQPARYMTAGQRFRYACWHDNGVTRPMKLTCERVAGLTPGSSIASGTLDDGDGPGRPCHTPGADPDECPISVTTGQCVQANLVFGPSADDDMCILPGSYYDPNPAAPPGHECDLAMMPALP